VCDWSLEVHLPFGDSTLVARPFVASGNSVSQISFDTAADNPHIDFVQGMQVDEIEMLGSPRSDADSEQPNSKWYAADIFVSETERLCGNCSTEDIGTILLGGLEFYGISVDSKTLPRTRRVTSKSQEGCKWMKTWLRLSKQREHLNRQAHQHETVPSEVIAGYQEVPRGLEEVNIAELSSFWSQMPTLLERKPLRSTKGYI
jgi:hypothetical protein